MLLTRCFWTLSFIWTGITAKDLFSCNRHLFDGKVASCLSLFQESMELSGYNSSCPWPAVKSVYNQLKLCVDSWANLTRCKGYGSLVDDVYLKIHETYFLLCGQVRDPPVTTLVLLIAPCIIATIIVPVISVIVN